MKRTQYNSVTIINKSHHGFEARLHQERVSYHLRKRRLSLNELSRTRARGGPRYYRTRRLRRCRGQRLPRRRRLPAHVFLERCVQNHHLLRGCWHLRDDQSRQTQRRATSARVFLQRRRTRPLSRRPSGTTTGCPGTVALVCRGPRRDSTRLRDAEAMQGAVVPACRAVVPAVDLSFEVVNPYSELLVSQLVQAETIDADVTTSPPVCFEMGMSTAGSAK